MQKNFDNETSLENRRVPLQSFPVLSDKRVPTENRDIPLIGI